MKIEKYEKIGKDKYRLYLDNGEVIDTYDEVILRKELLLKKELTNEDYQNIFLETTFQEHYNACSKYISIRLRSTKEIEDYLKKREVTQEDMEIIIEKLQKLGLLNDEYFTECFIKDKLKFTTMGKYRIHQELKKHHIPSELIIKYDYLMEEDILKEKINKIIEKKQKSNKKTDKFKLRNQLYHQLLNLGYPSQLVISTLNIYFQ